MGQQQLGAVFGIGDLPGRVVFYRSDKLCGDSAGTAQIHAAGRRNRGVYYLHGD